MKNHTNINKHANRREFLAITLAVMGIMGVTVGGGGETSTVCSSALVR
jgi:hypothetical protein